MVVDVHGLSLRLEQIHRVPEVFILSATMELDEEQEYWPIRGSLSFIVYTIMQVRTNINLEGSIITVVPTFIAPCFMG